MRDYNGGRSRGLKSSYETSGHQKPPSVLQPATAETRLRAHAFDWESCEEALHELLGGAGGGVQRKRVILFSIPEFKDVWL